jgi:hypothetical protein
MQTASLGIGLQLWLLCSLKVALDRSFITLSVSLSLYGNPLY